MFEAVFGGVKYRLRMGMAGDGKWEACLLLKCWKYWRYRFTRMRAAM